MSKKERPATLMEVILVCAIFSVITFMAIHFLPFRPYPTQTNENPAAKIVIVDSDRLMEAKLRELGKRLDEDPNADVRGEGERFAKRLNEEVQKLGRRGYVVLQARYALVYPQSMDMTHAVAQAVGIPKQ